MLDIKVYKKQKLSWEAKISLLAWVKQLKNGINNSIACQSMGQRTPPAKIQPSALRDEVWDTLNVDFLGPLPNGKCVFAIMDQQSRFQFAAVTTSTLS